MTALRDYAMLLKIKPKNLQSQYPFVHMDNQLVSKTLNQIGLMYKNLTIDDKDKKNKKGGAIHTNVVTIITGT